MGTNDDEVRRGLVRRKRREAICLFINDGPFSWSWSLMVGRFRLLKLRHSWLCYSSNDLPMGQSKFGVWWPSLCLSLTLQPQTSKEEEAQVLEWKEAATLGQGRRRRASTVVGKEEGGTCATQGAKRHRRWRVQGRGGWGIGGIFPQHSHLAREAKARGKKAARESIRLGQFTDFLHCSPKKISSKQFFYLTTCFAGLAGVLERWGLSVQISNEDFS